MNINHRIFRTIKIPNYKTPYLKITSLTKEKNENINNNIINIKSDNEQKENNINILKRSNTNKNENEISKIKSPISNNINYSSEKFLSSLNKRRIKIMKDSETNTDPITEVINNSQFGINNNNAYNRHYLELKEEESSQTMSDKIVSLKKKFKYPNNHSISDRYAINKNSVLKVPKIMEKNSVIYNNRMISSSLKKTKLKNENNNISPNLVLEECKENIFSNNGKKKSKGLFINYCNIKKNYTINKIDFRKSDNFFLNNKKNENNNNRNILSAISFSKSKDLGNKYHYHEYIYNLLNKNNIFVKKKFYITKINKNDNILNEELKKNPLINNDMNKIIKKENLSNRKHNLGHKNIKFNPCIYNLFNVPVIENNNSLEATIKQQTVSNFNNKYNFKFKTKNPKVKEKIKNLFTFLKKHNNLIDERNNDINKYYYLKNKYKNSFD